MKIGIVGQGKMGYNLSLNAMDHGHQVVAFDVDAAAIKRIEEAGATGADSLEKLVALMEAPRVIWMMVPAGELTENVIETLRPLLSAGDTLIDGGNSNYKDSVRRSESLLPQGIHYLDVGTSGGMEGARNGACAMIGGDAGAFKAVEPLFADICVENGYLYAGASGSGHFLKMVHNGIEYGMMQSIAEGFEVLERSGFDFNFEQVAKVWNNGSVIRSWLMELTENAFSKDAKLDGLKGVMQSSGEGKWTLETALDLQTATPVIAMSLMMRYRSLQDDTFSGKVVAALRNEFGGHAVVNS
ncbi:phosphogluconate dehydrogenase (NAD(+)-dependent, decarboxylating) [Paenibacillus sp. MMS18-CY102]|uniref:phosphogluconate dehydrogenase (NAD(+)-dependent, decarboxylating) n=1 Tax=Paenibacillus sp. MMS18-CY102 TaxID=2682849 RepID=UPI0013663925|nr:decarboxylating 6-phosphogluconate dehydrogenase [Paenibacillus sp. MMS18-CY102]MWC31251.1 decarboxylating 6-phosphogluconate dehydrogenase [Paenibacillus sp. MMS18-CY102]